MSYTAEIDEAALEAGLIRSLGPWLVAKCDSVAMLAIEECPVGDDDPLGRPREFPKHMRDTIRSYVENEDSLDMVGWVVVETPYALAVHEGSRPHEITPRGQGYPLRFVMPKAGGVVIRTRKVNHPGYGGNPFLVRAAEHVVAASRV